MNEARQHSERIGPILLAPGVTVREILVFTFVVVAAICVLNFTALIQPFIFTEQLGVPQDQQGRLSGNLQMTQQAAVVLFLSLAGVLADRIGRRNVLGLAMIGYGIAMFAFPTVSTVAALFLVRFMFGLASTGHTAGAATKIVADYPHESSRGKFISMMLVVQNIAVALFVGYIGARIPSWLIEAGWSPSDAGSASFWMMGVFGFAGAAAAFLLMKPDHKVPDPTLANGAGEQPKSRLAALKQMGEVLAYARKYPRFGFILAVGFVIRTDTAILNAFLSLWVVRAAADVGVDSATAMKTAGLLLSILSVASFVTPPIFGYVADRVNRTHLLVLGLALTAGAFLSTTLVDDVFGWGIIIVVVFIGLAEGAQTIAAQSVFGQEAPKHLRGSAMGVYATLGTISVLFVSYLGGVMFDKVGYSGPFVVAGGLHLLFCIGALLFIATGRLGTQEPARDAA